MTHQDSTKGRAASPKGRVLIVEDDAMIAWDTALTLEGAGFEVAGIVATGADAVAQAVTEPDLILMDVNLKGEMDGIETARALRARGTRARIIFITGYGDPQTAARVRAFAPDGYLLKPVMPEELEAVVREALQGAR